MRRDVDWQMIVTYMMPRVESLKMGLRVYLA